MYTTTLFTLALASLALSQETLSTDGQIQSPSGVPTGPGPEIVSTEILVSSTTAPYENPFTSYHTETDSYGVVTGMPTVVTSQPAAVTEQPISPTLPSYSGYAYGNSTTVGVVPTTLSSVTETTETTEAPSVPSSSGTASATFAEGTGGADINRVAGCGVALVVLGVAFSML